MTILFAESTASWTHVRRRDLRLLAAALLMAAAVGCGRNGDSIPPTGKLPIRPPAPVAGAPMVPTRTVVVPADPSRPRRATSELGLDDLTIDALGRIGDAAVPSLVSALHDGDRNLRVAAARALARIGADAKEAVPDLITALSDEDEMVRRTAIRALGQIGPAAHDAVPALMDELKQSLVKPPRGTSGTASYGRPKAQSQPPVPDEQAPSAVQPPTPIIPKPSSKVTQ